jgi:4a-hydroxytetrahydrobiopterin dehydratase
MNDLASKKCIPCEGGTAKISVKTAQSMLQSLHGWQLDKDDLSISKKFNFKNYYHTMAFVNLIAWISHQENHHPDMVVSYNSCEVKYTTHAINGLSENDFICASKIDKLHV